MADTDEPMLASPLTLSDVYLTGYNAAHMGRVEPGRTVTVVGDGRSRAVRGASRSSMSRRVIKGGSFLCTPTYRLL